MPIGLAVYESWGECAIGDGVIGRFMSVETVLRRKKAVTAGEVNDRL